MRLYTKLKSYSKLNITPFHMPGHKRKLLLKNDLPYDIDITEIYNFDNLYHANGILKQCQDKATKLYGTKGTFYLINGSTSGILASICSVCDINDKIIIPQNCHKSVFNAIELLNLKIAFIPTKIDENYICNSIDEKVLENTILNNIDAKAILITSPTYEGVLSNIQKIAEIVHKYNKILIVDEAHGAHLFLENKSAINYADIVINSLHKTLPSLTQTALLHICTHNVDINKVKKYISVFNSSSPSYVLMSSMDECIEFLIKNGKKYYQKLKNNINFFLNNTKLQNLRIYSKQDNFDYDETKIVITTSNCNINGNQLAKLLRKNNIECEMCYNNYVLCLCSIFDDKKDFIKLSKILQKIDKNLKKSSKKCDFTSIFPQIDLNIKNALSQNNCFVQTKDCLNHICCEYVYVYPPGIPILVPGQRITQQILDTLYSLQSSNIEILCNRKNYIQVVKN